MVLNFHVTFLHRDGLLDRKRDADLLKRVRPRSPQKNFVKKNNSLDSYGVLKL